MSPLVDDPRPMPPVPPGPEDCCKGSCDPCVFDLYDDALERYRSDLQAWEERQARRIKDPKATEKKPLLGPIRRWARFKSINFIAAALQRSDQANTLVGPPGGAGRV